MPVPITFISSHGEIGGSEIYMESLMRLLGPEWVRLAVLLEDGPLAAHLRKLGCRVEVVPMGGKSGVPATALKVRALLRRHGTRVIHANGAKSAVVATAASAGTGVRVIWNKVDGTGDGWQAQAIARGCDQVVGISKSVTETFRGALRSRVHVVYPGIPSYEVDRQRGRSMVLDLLGCPPTAEVVVLSGRLCPPKGQLELIESLPDLLRRRPALRLAVLGGENLAYAGYETFLRERARALGVEHEVSFVGHRSEAIRNVADAVRFVSGCNVLAVPSMVEPQSGWKEGFGLSPVEAMWVGTPVVAYRNGSLPEVLGDCAWMVEEGDRQALADGVVRLLEDAPVRESLIRCGRTRADRYQLPVSVAGMKDRYREAASRGSSRSSWRLRQT